MMHGAYNVKSELYFHIRSDQGPFDCFFLNIIEGNKLCSFGLLQLLHPDSLSVYIEGSRIVWIP